MDGGNYSNFAFQITNNSKHYSFSAPSAEIVMCWVNALNKAISTLFPVNSTFSGYSQIKKYSSVSFGSVGKKLEKSRKSIITFFDQQPKLEKKQTFTASSNSAPILPPAHVRPRARTVANCNFNLDTPVPDEFIKAASSNVSNIVLFFFFEYITNYKKKIKKHINHIESATDFIQRRRRGEVLVVSRKQNPTKYHSDSLGDRLYGRKLPIPPPRRKKQRQAAPKDDVIESLKFVLKGGESVDKISKRFSREGVFRNSWGKGDDC